MNERRRTLLEVTEARGLRPSYELALLSLLGSSSPEVDTSAGGSANGSSIGTLSDGTTERRETSGGSSCIGTGSSKGSCTGSAEAGATIGGSCQPRVFWIGESTGREGSLDCCADSVWCISDAREKSNGRREARRTRRRRRWFKPTRIRMRTITAAIDAAIAATGTELLIHDKYAIERLDGK
jgi:hypothetical protein